MISPGGFWKKPLSMLEIFDTRVRAAYIAAWHAARVMVAKRSGLIVGLSGYVGVTYTYDVVFGTTKSALDCMARDMAIELNAQGVASISLWQGFTLTEGLTAEQQCRQLTGISRPRDPHRAPIWKPIASHSK